MRALQLFPPLGWITAIAVATATGLFLQDGSELPAIASAPILVGQEQGQSSGLSLPPLSNAEQALQLFSARPLLAEGRRPFVPDPLPVEAELEPATPAPEPEPVAEDPVTPPALILLGTIKRSEGWQALLREEASGIESWFAEGDEVSGWAIVQVQPESVTLQLQDNEITFHLFQNPVP
jgi:hypothetical protein